MEYRSTNKDYSAEVIIANNGKKLFFYDLINIKSISINERRGTNKPLSTKGKSLKTSTSSNNSISNNPEKSNIKKSVQVDSEGRTLTPQQQEYFKDVAPQLRDGEERLKLFYHGTPQGGFTVFKNDLQFFTEDKEYAENYQSPSASSRGYGKQETNPQTYEVYLNIKKPFDIRDAKTKELFVNEYVKEGWALGINPYEEFKDTTNTGLPSWEEADNIYEWLEETDRLDDYDGIIVDEGGIPQEDGSVKSRGIAFVTFNQNQIKNVTNENPTNNSDIRYSINIDAEGKSYVEIDQDIFGGISLNNIEKSNRKEMSKIAKKKLLSIFNPGQKIQNNIFKMNKADRKEFVGNKSMMYYLDNDKQLYIDKLRLSNNATEIIEAGENWINIKKEHSSANAEHLIDFAYGEAKISVFENDYNAKVVVGMDKEGYLHLYDINEMNRITIKKEAPPAGHLNKNSNISGTSRTKTIQQKNNDVNIKHSLSSFSNENRALLRELSRYDDYESLMNAITEQMTVAQGVKIRTDGIGKLAKQLRSEANSTYSIETIRRELSRILNGDTTVTDKTNEIKSLVKDVLSKKYDRAKMEYRSTK